MDHETPTFAAIPEKVQGLDLKIDANVQKICETYNQSSGASRSVIYVLLVVCVIAVIAVVNSNWYFNWTEDRIDDCNQKVLLYADSIQNKVKYQFNVAKVQKLENTRDSLKKKEEIFMRADVDNNDSIKASIVGIIVDVNDLASLFGMTIIVLLIILRFTLIREKNNLQIALISINERYPSAANATELQGIYAPEYPGLPLDDKSEWTRMISQVNLMRRKFHYNYLSMNEVFNLPYLDSNKSTIQDKPIGKAVNHYLFYFILVVYSYIMFNDFCSLQAGINLNAAHTLMIILLGVVFYCIVFDLIYKCTVQKNMVTSLFKNFYDQKYHYDDGDYSSGRRSPGRTILRALGLLALIWVLSFGSNKGLSPLIKFINKYSKIHWAEKNP